MVSSPASLRGALIGFGQVAEKAHLPAFKEHGIEIAAVVDESPERLKAASAALPAARSYSSMDAMLGRERGLDFLDIATPPFLHSSQALAALKAGLHVLCEKPLALSPEELEALRRYAAKAGRAVFTVHNWAYAPQWLKVFSLVAEGRLGEISHVELHALRTQPAASAVPGDWRRKASQAGGGILVDHGWHNLYLLHRLVQARSSRIVARLRPPAGAVDEEATLWAEFPTATGLIHLSWRSAVRRNSALIVGARAVLELLDDEITLRSSSGIERFSFSEALSAGSAHPTWFSNMLPDFVAEARDPGKRGRNFDEAEFCLGIIHRAYEEARR